MNRNRLIFGALILMAMMGISMIAQTRPVTTTSKPAATPVVGNAAVPDSRISLIDTGMFADVKNGIFIYVDAAKKVQLDFQTRTTELQSLDNRLTALANEIKTLMQ